MNKGQQAENFADNWLRNRGLTIVARNVNYGFGELDIVAMQNDVVVFIEVKYRKRSFYGEAHEQVGYHKQEKLRKAANAYLQEHHSMNQAARFDVLAIDGQHINWIKDAF